MSSISLQFFIVLVSSHNLSVCCVRLKDRDAQLAEKSHEIKELKAKISSLEKALQSASRKSNGESEPKKTRLEQELALAEAKSFIRINEANNRDESKARRKQEEEAAKSKAKSDQIAKLQSTALSMGQTHQGFANSATGNNLFGMLGSGGGALQPMGGGRHGMGMGGMQGMGMMNGGMQGMGMQGMGMGVGMNNMAFRDGMGIGCNGGGGATMQSLAASFNGPVGNPVSIAGGHGGGAFGGGGVGMAGVDSRGAGFCVGGGATAGDSGYGGAVAGVDGGGGQVAAYAKAPVDAGMMGTAQYAALPNPGVNPVANSLTDPALIHLQDMLQEQQQQQQQQGVTNGQQQV